MRGRFVVMALVVMVLAVWSSVAMAQGGQRAYLPIALNAGVPPTITPTPQSGGVVVLDNHTAYPYDGTPNFNDWYIVGEIRNQTEQVIERLYLTVDFFAGSGLVSTQTFAYNPVGYIPPGEKQCFWGKFGTPNNPLPEFDNYVIREPEYQTINAIVDPLLVGAVEITQTLRSYEIEAIVYNDTDNALVDIRPNYTLYNTEGDVAGCNYNGIDTPEDFDLDADRSRSIETEFGTREQYLDVVSYRVVAHGVRIEGTPTPTPN